MGEQIAPELVERMVALVRQIAGKALEGQLLHDVDVEARAIAAELLVSVDPDLSEAREIAAGYATSGPEAKLIRSGNGDYKADVHMALDAIKRGRELALAQGHAA